MQIEFLKMLKKHFEAFRKISQEENKKLKEFYEDKQVLNYIKLLYSECHNESEFIMPLILEEDDMLGALIHHGVYDENIYIDAGLYLLTSTDSQKIGTTKRLINIADIEDIKYINNNIKYNSNSLINQTMLHEYIGLETGMVKTIVEDENTATSDLNSILKGKSLINPTIVKLPSLIKKELEITPIRDEIKTDFSEFKAYYMGDEIEYYKQNHLKYRFAILRAQFFLRMIKENPDEILEYYKNIENWEKIEKNVDNYYLKKKKYKEKIIKKLDNL